LGFFILGDFAFTPIRTHHQNRARRFLHDAVRIAADKNFY